MQNIIKQNRNLIGLLGVHITFFTLDVFISTFLVARLYTITNNNIGAVALFNLISLSVLFFFFSLFSYIVKRHSKVNMLRIGIFINMILIVLIVLFESRLGELYLIFGMINGVAMGIYWASMHTLAGNLISKDKVSTYMIYSQVTFTAAKIIFPLTLGAIIEYVDFSLSGWIVASFGVFVLLFTFFLKEEKVKSEKLSMRNFFTVVKKDKLKKPVLFNFIIQFMYGAYANSINLSITILIVIVYNNNFSLGILSSIFAASSILLLTCYRFIKNTSIKKIVYFSSVILVALLTIGIQFDINSITILLFLGSYLTLSGIVRSESDALRLNIMKILQHEEIVIESNLFAEGAYWLARLFSLGLLIAVSSIDVNLFPIFIFIMILLMLISSILIKVWYKKYNNNM